MPSTYTILVILGAILVLAGIVGGGLSLKEFKIPALNKFSRILACTFGVIFIVAGIYLEKMPDKQFKLQEQERLAAIAEQKEKDRLAAIAEQQEQEQERLVKQKEKERLAAMERQKKEQERLAEKITVKWFNAYWNHADLDTIVSLSKPPFFLDNDLYTSSAEIRKGYQKIGFDKPRTKKIDIKQIMSGSIREYKSKGIISKNDRLLSHMKLNEDDTVVKIMITAKGHSTVYGVVFYFRRTSQGVEMAGFWD